MFVSGKWGGSVCGALCVVVARGMCLCFVLLEVNPDSAPLLAYWPAAAAACAVDVCLLLTAYCLLLSVCSNTDTV